MLVAALVRIAMEKMREGSAVTLRVSSNRVDSWRKYFAGVSEPGSCGGCRGRKSERRDCIVETELGSANFGLDTQLKEVEQGFFDLLALRPNSK